MNCEGFVLCQPCCREMTIISLHSSELGAAVNDRSLEIRKMKRQPYSFYIWKDNLQAPGASHTGSRILLLVELPGRPAKPAASFLSSSDSWTPRMLSSGTQGSISSSKALTHQNWRLRAIRDSRSSAQSLRVLVNLRCCSFHNHLPAGLVSAPETKQIPSKRWFRQVLKCCNTPFIVYRCSSRFTTGFLLLAVTFLR